MTKDKKAEFFIELLSEEMPARMQRQAELDFRSAIGARLDKAGLLDSEDAPHADSYEEIADAWSTPRRLAVYFPKVRVIEPTREEEKRGPRTDAPTKAINGFLRSSGITEEESEKRQTPKGEFYFAVQKHKGRKAVDILPILIADVIANFKWPKSMRWGTGQKRWIRPLHGIVALFDGKALKGEVDFGGEQKIYLGNKTRGHRFLDDNNLVTITSGADYEKIMMEHFVIAHRNRRKLMLGGEFEGWDQVGKPFKIANHRLFAEVIGLVEYPNAIQVEIDKEFMTLPERIRITTIESHQKFLHLPDSEKKGGISNFIMVADSVPDKERDKRIRIGAERVMRARLKDAKFFLEEDEKTGLDAMRKRLDGMAFFNGLGTMGNKTERLIKLTRDYAGSFEIDKGEIEKAARYAKADLASNTVNELPSLQGFMGGYLARQEYGDVVADAIPDHYSDDGGFSRNDSHLLSFQDNLGRYLGLMDRIDTLAAFMAIGKMPTGSKDPYALRRAGSSIVGIITRVKESVPLGEIFYKALDYLEEDGVRLFKPREKLYNDFIFFLHDRARNMVGLYEDFRFVFDDDRNDGFNTMFLDAVFHRDTEDKDRIKYLCYLVGDLRDFVKESHGMNFIIAYKRLANFLDSEDKKDAEQRGNPKDALFQSHAEESLYESIEKVQKALSDARNGNPSIDKKIEALKNINSDIHYFFTTVRVNDEDPKIRQNRLNLLHLARAEIKKVADFDKIQYKLNTLEEASQNDKMGL